MSPRAGLGLPDKAYYFDADKKKDLQAYEAHIAKVLELSGVAAADAATQAKDVIAFETRLAKVSKSSEELSRDVSLYYNPVTIEAADKATPNFPWSKFFEAQGITAPKMFSMAIPAFHADFDKMLADTPVAAWKSYLRFHTVDGASPYLSDAFANEHFNFYRATLRGQKGTAAALEARAERPSKARAAKRWARCTCRSRSRRSRRRAWNCS